MPSLQEVNIMQWIFFDVGSTLVDETEAYDHRAREMLEATHVTFEEFDAMRIILSKQGLDGNSAAIEHFGLTKTPWHTEDERLFPDAAETLQYLKECGYRLGIIANQVAGLKERLDAWGIGLYFDVIASSAELGVAKPALAIFEKAIHMAGCRAEDAYMVGDRVDNDILPAKAMGMKTVWIRKGLSTYQASDAADYIIADLRELSSIFGGSMQHETDQRTGSE